MQANRKEQASYNNKVEVAVNNLQIKYKLETRYSSEKLTAIKNKTKKLIEVNTIDPEIFFRDHHKGLIFMGLASISLDVEKAPEHIRQKEEQRINYAIQIIASEKKNFPQTEQRKIMLKKILPYKDQEKSEILQKRQNDMLPKFQINFPSSVIPSDIEWIVTKLPRDQFEKMFHASVMLVDAKIFLPEDIDSDVNKNSQQHVLLRTILQHSSSILLGRGLAGEPDAQNNIDKPKPQIYSIDRLVSYYVDDLIKNKTGTDGVTARVLGAIQRGKGIINSEEESVWNAALIETVGLEGLATYYLTKEKNDRSYSDELLLDSQQSAYRLQAYCGYHHEGKKLLEDIYSSSLSIDAIGQQIPILSSFHEALLNRWNIYMYVKQIEQNPYLEASRRQ